MEGNATDGCGEFMPNGESTLEALKCTACNCHRNFHVKEMEGESSCECYHHPHLNRVGRKVIVGNHNNILGPADALGYHTSGRWCWGLGKATSTSQEEAQDQVLSRTEGKYVELCREDPQEEMSTPPGIVVAGIDLNHANLQCSLVKELSLLSDMSLLSLNKNRFTSTVPNAFRDLSSLSKLDLNNNHFSGPFPSVTLLIPNLIYLNLRFNNCISDRDMQRLD
ncbi:hypothetical protein HHK36_019294 [Tetracentron sinense]|uniref:ZF-HD dimerization-type domain-containing protein n=1 Tax=Tetracentron sinense TaxID=13715 RepID=A0A834YZP6_TETSI|nr:hypothetical protein HHK36_019294 [Tetracentron sinense]